MLSDKHAAAEQVEQNDNVKSSEQVLGTSSDKSSPKEKRYLDRFTVKGLKYLYKIHFE